MEAKSKLDAILHKHFTHWDADELLCAIEEYVKSFFIPANEKTASTPKAVAKKPDEK